MDIELFTAWAVLIFAFIFGVAPAITPLPDASYLERVTIGNAFCIVLVVLFSACWSLLWALNTVALSLR